MDQTQIINELQFIQEQEKLLATRRDYLLNILTAERQEVKSAPPEEEFDDFQDPDLDEFDDEYEPDPPEVPVRQNERNVRFDDAAFTITWNSGKMYFRQDGSKLYRFIKMIWKSGNQGVTHTKVAVALFGDELANLKKIVHRARDKLAENKFFKKLQNFGGKFYLQ